jgi:hypothetical protein
MIAEQSDEWGTTRRTTFGRGPMVGRSPSLLLRSLRTAAYWFRAAEGAVTTASRWRVERRGLRASMPRSSASSLALKSFSSSRSGPGATTI